MTLVMCSHPFFDFPLVKGRVPRKYFLDGLEAAKLKLKFYVVIDCVTRRDNRKQTVAKAKQEKKIRDFLCRSVNKVDNSLSPYSLFSPFMNKQNSD